ncbi:MAG: peptidoglycan DD-metalloendopeptidase family protein [Patescibacteria group bacterium]
MSNRSKLSVLLIIAVLLATFQFQALAEESTSTPAETPAEEAQATASGFTREDLLKEIQLRNQQLEELNKNLDTTKQSLQETQAQKRTLQSQLSILNTTLSQLDLNIKSDQVRIEKLGLEISALGYDLHDIETSIEDRRQAIAKIFIEVQQNDYLSGNLLVVFLRSSSLADGFLEMQSLETLQSKLTIDIEDLLALRERYNLKIAEAGDKKGDLEYNKRNLEQRKLIAADQKSVRQNLLVQTKSQESTFQKQLAELQALQQQIATEIESLGAILRTQIDPATLPKPESGVLLIPIKGATKSSITQGYGSTSFAQSGYRGKWHNGVDFRAILGTPVLASEDGVVVAAGDQDKYCYKGAYGKFIIINHNNNLTTLYAHLSRIIVEKDHDVKRGEVIGYSGSTGYATGPHLHLTVFAQPTFYMGPSKVCGPMPFGGDLNPLGYL